MKMSDELRCHRMLRHAVAYGESSPADPSFGETIHWALFLMTDKEVADLVAKYKDSSELAYELTGWSSYMPGSEYDLDYWESAYARVQGSRVLVKQARGYDM